MSQEILYSVEESIATITLNRPERMNALTHELEAELHRIFDRADADRGARVIILTGAGRAFCAGYDQSTTDKSDVRHISNTTFLFGALCGWKAANRWGLTGDHFDAQEALRIGMVNEVVPHDQLMDATRALAKRIALVPEPSVRLNKSITMLGMQAAGVYSGLLLEGALGALAHSSHNEFREKLFETQREHGLKAYLDMRDGPFQPEPMGPRSAKGRQKKAGP